MTAILKEALGPARGEKDHTDFDEDLNERLQAALLSAQVDKYIAMKVEQTEAAEGIRSRLLVALHNQRSRAGVIERRMHQAQDAFQRTTFPGACYEYDPTTTRRFEVHCPTYAGTELIACPRGCPSVSAWHGPATLGHEDCMPVRSLGNEECTAPPMVEQCQRSACFRLTM